MVYAVSDFDYSLEGVVRAMEDAGLSCASPAMRMVARQVYQVLDYPEHVLVVGTPGSGKSMLSRVIAKLIEGKRGTIDCTSLGEGIIESELFGHVKGSYSGAHNDRVGLFENLEVVVLEELGELSSKMQAKVLGVLQDGIIRPVGSNEERPVEATIVANTNVDIDNPEVFRADLRARFYHEIHMPSLAERGDIVEIANKSLAKINAKKRRPVEGLCFSDDAKQWLREYQWPGNYRDLESLVVFTATTPGIVEIGLEEIAVWPKLQGMKKPERTIHNSQPSKREEVAVELSKEGWFSAPRFATAANIDVKTARTWLKSHALSNGKSGRWQRYQMRLY